MKINKQLICGLCLLASILNAQALSVICRKNTCINILTADELAIEKANSETGLTLDHIKTWIQDWLYPPIIDEPTLLLNLEELLDTDSLKVRIGFEELDLLSTDSGSGDRAVLITKNPCIIRVFIESKQLIFDITVSIKKNEPVISNIQEISREEYLAGNAPTPPQPPTPPAPPGTPLLPITDDLNPNLAQAVVKSGYVVMPKDMQVEGKKVTIVIRFKGQNIPPNQDDVVIMNRIQGYSNYAPLGVAKSDLGNFYWLAIKIGNDPEIFRDIRPGIHIPLRTSEGKKLVLYTEHKRTQFSIGNGYQTIDIYIVTIRPE